MAKKKQKTIGFEKRPVRDDRPKEGDTVSSVSGSSPDHWDWHYWMNTRPEAKGR
jgi:hypothetical protein